MLEGNKKYRDGTVIKQFSNEDEKLKSIVVKDLEDEELTDWIEVSINVEKKTKEEEEVHPIPPIL
jgi:hypothetical protein